MNEITQLFAILFGVIGIETILILLVFWKTPAMTFLIASLTKRSILINIGRDKVAEFLAFPRKYGAAWVKKEGIYNLTEGSHILEAKTKIPMFLAFRDFASTLSMEYPAILQELREKGHKLTDVEDLTNLIRDIKKGKIEEITIDVKAYKTYKVHDLLNMFPFNLDPTFIDAQIQGELNRFNKLIKGTQTMMMGIVMLVIISAVAVFIIQRAFKGSIGIGECKEICTSVAQAANTGIPAIINNTPLVK